MKDGISTSSGDASLSIYELNPFVSYHFMYGERQFAVPFIRVGPYLAWAMQTGGGDLGQAGFAAIRYAAGLELLMNVLDGQSAKMFEKTTGIERTFVTIEAVGSAGSKVVGPDSGTDLSNSGFRFGIRFEM